MTLGWGIVGPGGWADRFIAPAIQESEQGRLVAILSRDKGRAQAFARGYEAERGYDNLEEFLAHPGLDIVYVGTPNNLHAATVIPAAAAGKHILCEIAMAATEEDCIAMIEACRRHNVMLGLEQQTRYHPANRELKHLIDSGVLGDIVVLKAQMCLPWRGGVRYGAQTWKRFTGPAIEHSPPMWHQDVSMRGGGMSTAGGIFTVDMLRFMAGREVEEVMGFSDQAAVEGGMETLLLGTLAFEGGIYGVLDASGKNPYADNNLTVYGTKGRATSIGGLQLASDGTLEVLSETGMFRKEYTGYNMYVDEVDAFNRCVQWNVEPSPSGVDGWRERQVNIAMIESSWQNAPVKIRK